MREGRYVAGGGIYEHRVVAARALGRPLPPGTVVHHVNEDPRDNRPENLVLCPNDAYHFLLHARARIVDRGGNPYQQAVCGVCEQLLFHDAFSRRATSWNGRASECKSCSNSRRRGKYKKTPQQIREYNGRRRSDPLRWERHLEWTRLNRAKKRSIAICG